MLKILTEKLKSAEDVFSPELEARWLLEWSTDEEKLDRAVKLRHSGYPLAYILGEKEFYSLPFIVDSSVLIPRPETELLVDEAIRWAKKRDTKLQIMDWGVGSGCLGLSVIYNLPESRLLGLEISSKALDLANANARALNLSDRTTFLNIPVEDLAPSSLPPGCSRSVDIILANPPYIDKASGEIEFNVKKFEPELALYAGENGYACHMGWAKLIPEFLAKSGLVLFEIGYDQGARVKTFFDELGVFAKVDVIKDYSGKDRVVRGIRE